MARKIVNYVVSDEGRDKGKTFVLTEMPAAQGEAWAMRAILALTAENVDIPPGFERMGMAGLIELGIRSLSKLKWETAKPLLDEMFECAQFMPEPTKPHIVRSVFDGDIEEIGTRIKMRAEIIKLHADFLNAVVNLNSGANAAATQKRKYTRRVSTSLQQ